jgi:colanic acid biosynthesis protein WcaH
MTAPLEIIESTIQDPTKGLPEDIFLFISRITPLVNVDLLIRNELNQTLLTWRNDGYYPAGWHVPGGIIRYKETMQERIHAVAATELGATVDYSQSPLAINEIIHPNRKNRGHFISFLYQCRLTGKLDDSIRYAVGNPRPGEWAWHDKCPDNFISVHEIYRTFI